MDRSRHAGASNHSNSSNLGKRTFDDVDLVDLPWPFDLCHRKYQQGSSFGVCQQDNQ
jgi:hypothetical protein